MHLFFTDLDGTLFNDDRQITPRTAQAIDAYIAAGNKFIISSGRPLTSVQKAMKETGLDKYENLLIICYNGSLIYDCDAKKPLLDLRLKKEDALHIINTAEEMGIHCQTYSSTQVVCRRPCPEVDFYNKHTRMTACYDEDILPSVDEDPYKALAISLDDKSRLYALIDKLSPWMEGKIMTLFSNDKYLEFVDYRSGKGNAVRNVCEIFGVPAAEAYAAGDANNDLSMLEAVGNSIAMINGSSEVKAVSSIITTEDNNHDGLADILLQLA